MNAKITMFVLVGLIISVPAVANDGWYRFPTELEGKWRIADARTGGHVRDVYVRQIADINGSTLLLRSSKASNTYKLTFVNPGKTQIELDLTTTSPGGDQTKTFRCILAISKNQLRLCRPQNVSRPRPRDIESPDRSETIFTFVRDPASPKPILRDPDEPEEQIASEESTPTDARALLLMHYQMKKDALHLLREAKALELKAFKEQGARRDRWVKAAQQVAVKGDILMLDAELALVESELRQAIESAQLPIQDNKLSLSADTPIIDKQFKDGNRKEESHEMRSFTPAGSRCTFSTVGGRRPVTVAYQRGKGATEAKGRLFCFDQPHCRCQVRYVDLPDSALRLSLIQIANSYGFESWSKEGKLKREKAVKTGAHEGEEYTVIGLPSAPRSRGSAKHVRVQVFVAAKRAFFVSASCPDVMKSDAEPEIRAFLESFRIIGK